MSLWNFVKEKYIKNKKITAKNVSFLCVYDTYVYMDIYQYRHVTLIVSYTVYKASIGVMIYIHTHK